MKTYSLTYYLTAKVVYDITTTDEKEAIKLGAIAAEKDIQNLQTMIKADREGPKIVEGKVFIQEGADLEEIEQE